MNISRAWRWPATDGGGPTMDLAPHRQQVAHAPGVMEKSIERQVNAPAHQPLWIAVDQAATQAAAIRPACEAYAVPLHRMRIRVPIKGGDDPTKPIPVIRVILRSIQRSDLNLLAAYRKIPLLDAPPLSVTYTRANTRSTLDRRETHLALVKPRYQNIRANILFSRLDRRGRGRMQISAELPVMYATGRHSEPPQVTFLAADDEASNKLPRARESQPEAKPFLKSLPVWRYAK